jgi:ribosomal-protein-alanine N-acetyltransferase
MVAIRLLPATLEHLDAWRSAPTALRALIGSPIPEGWPEFPEGIEYTAEKLREHPEEAEWWMHFFLDSPTGRLVGSGGFVGPPVDGVVEIGYEVAPGLRGLGYGRAAAAALRDKAIASGLVDAVIAHTLAAESASTGVLSGLGFERVAAFTDPGEGELWRWRWLRPSDGRSA